MAGPAQTLCPKCGVRPRRAPGQRCRPCENEWQRARRGDLSNGAPPARRVTVSDEPKSRFTRALTGNRFIVTSAQNATPVHAEFFTALQVAAKHLGAELVVIPLRYKNPTSIWTSKQDDNEWWGVKPLEGESREAYEARNPLAPCLFNTRKKLGRALVLAADVKTQPTASSPLSGFEALTGAESCIIGHPKMQFRTVPAPTGKFPKILSTTGACTKRNYTDTKAGKLGAFHHFLGAVVVELDGPRFHLRQVNADRVDGSFTDLDLHFTATGVTKAPPAAGLVLGDTHARLTSVSVDRATFGKGGIVETLQPRAIVFHDLFDGYSVNPHHAGNPFVAHAKAAARFGDVRAEVEHAVEFVRSRIGKRQAVIAASNHDNFLARWIISTDWRSTGSKAFYLETAAAMLRSVRMTPRGTEYDDPFRYWVHRLKGNAPIKALRKDESFKIAGVECSLHGDKGPNGARATMKNLARIGTRTCTAHAHSPGIEEGNYKVGTSTELSLEYTGGPSSWANTHVVIYASGKRALITMYGDAWRGRRGKA